MEPKQKTPNADIVKSFMKTGDESYETKEVTEDFGGTPGSVDSDFSMRCSVILWLKE